MNITVLCGGISTERDVSLITGKNVAEALRRNGHNVLLLDAFLGYGEPDADISGIFEKDDSLLDKISAISEKAPDIATLNELRKDYERGYFGPNVINICRASDIVFMALHGEDGENGRVQAAFDLNRIRYTGTGYMSSALAMDKRMTRHIFKEAGVPVAEGISMDISSRSDEEPQCGFPSVVKPNCGGSSVGVSIAHNAEEYKEALDLAFGYENRVVVEEYVKGREFSVAVVDGEAYPIIEIKPKSGFYDYKNKYQAGATEEICPADLPEDVAKKMQGMAKKAADALTLDKYSRMDFILGDNGKMICLEANTLPGMTPTSLLPQEAAAIGISYDELCEKLIQVSTGEDR